MSESVPGYYLFTVITNRCIAIPRAIQRFLNLIVGLIRQPYTYYVALGTRSAHNTPLVDGVYTTCRLLWLVLLGLKPSHIRLAQYVYRFPQPLKLPSKPYTYLEQRL